MTKEGQKKSINIQTEIDENLTADDIIADIKKCDRMIKRTTFKLKTYARQLSILTDPSEKSKQQIKQGLSALNIFKQKTDA